MAGTQMEQPEGKLLVSSIPSEENFPILVNPVGLTKQQMETSLDGFTMIFNKIKRERLKDRSDILPFNSVTRAGTDLRIRQRLEEKVSSKWERRVAGSLFAFSERADLRGKHVHRLRQQVYGNFWNVPPLRWATLTGNINAVKKFSKCGNAEFLELLEMGSEEGMNCLHLAAIRGECPEVTQLRQHKERLCRREDSIQEEANGAVKFGEVLSFLVSIPGVDLNAVDKNGNTALILASYCGHYEAVEILLGTAMDMNIFNKEGFNCVHAAVSNGHSDVVSILAQTASQKNVQILNVKSRCRSGYEGTVLHFAVYYDQGKTLELLLSFPEVDVDAQDGNGETPLFMASDRGSVSSVLTLLGRGANMYVEDTKGRNCLLEAASRGHLAVLTALLEHPSSKFKPHLKLVGQSQTDSEHLQAQMSALLWEAAAKGRDGIVEWLLKGFDFGVDVQNSMGNTALMIASEQGHTSTVEILGQYGADMLVFNTEGYNCVHKAASNGSYGVLKFMFGEDGDEEFWRGWSRPKSDDTGRYNDRLRILELQSLDSKELTPLHLAAKGQHIETVILLLRAYIILALRVRGFHSHPRVHKYMLPFLDIVRESHLLSDGMKDASGASDVRNKLVAYCKFIADQEGWKQSFLDSTDVMTDTSQDYEVRVNVVENFVDVYINFLIYSNLRDSEHQRTFLHFIADSRFTPWNSCHHGALDCPMRSGVDEMCPMNNLLRITAMCVINTPDRNGDTSVHLMSRHGNLCMLSHILRSVRTPDLLASNSSGESPCSTLWNICESHIFATCNGIGKNVRSVCACHSVGNETRDCNHFATFRLVETYVLTSIAFTDRKNIPVIRNTMAAFVRQVIRVLERRQIPQSEAEHLQKEFWDENHSKGVTLLHYLALRGLDLELEYLRHEFDQEGELRHLINRQYDWNGQTALHFAVNGKEPEVIRVLLELSKSSLLRNVEDKSSRTPYELLSEIVSSDYSSSVKEMAAYLVKDIDVSAFMEKQYRDRQVHVDAGNSALVGAALIASVTFAGWLQPPLGYAEYNQFGQEQFAAVEQHFSVRVFWFFNSLSFFFAIATVVSGARAVLPAPYSQFIAKEVRHMRRWLVLTSFLLVASIVCVLGAFAAAGFATLPPISKHRSLMTVTSAVGGVVCTGVVIVYFFRLIAIFSRASSRFWSVLAKFLPSLSASRGANA